MDYFNEYIPIPKIFWSVETDKAFEKCSICDCNILENETNYVIEKAFNKGEVIFEYAMCLDCQKKLYNELSDTSKKLISHYFDEHVDLNKRQSELLNDVNLDYEKWMSNCIIKGDRINKSEEYQIYGYFIDNDMILNGFPYALCGAVADDITNLLSSKTLGILNDFSDKVFGLDLPKGLLVI